MGDKERRTEEFSISGGRIMDRVHSLWREANARRVVVRRDGKRQAEVNLPLAVAGTLIAPKLMLGGAAVALLARCSVGVERVEQE